jgi:hypothetical protein
MIDAALACSASIIYVSAIFLPDMISVKSTGLSLLYIVVAGLLFSLTMISKDKKTVFIKWLISGFFGFAVWWLFVRCEFAMRALNWMIPEYGNSRSAGGNFAGAVGFLILTALCAVGLIINLFLRVKDYERFRKIQLVICMTVAAAVIAVVFILERQFPSSDLIHS